MPELPEVETIVRDLNKTLLNKIFSKVIIQDAFVLRTASAEFIKRLVGGKISKIARRGKAVLIYLDTEEILVVQLMMTGQLVVNTHEDKHTRVAFIFSDKAKLLYNDQRRFGQLRVVKNLNEIKYFNILGPEPFSKEFTPAYVRQAFYKTSRPIKTLLLDHTFVAGIGNIYACEILFRSRVSPERIARMISVAGADVIHRQIIDVLKEAIVHRGSSMRNYRDGAGQKGSFGQRLAVYGRQALPCFRCKTLIQRIVQAGRSTFYCARCQK
jgi:formamidopyrimidine-DNA glycosylase